VRVIVDSVGWLGQTDLHVLSSFLVSGCAILVLWLFVALDAKHEFR
jgi:hypothetical protein